MTDKTIPDVVYLDFAPDFVSVSQHAHDEYHVFIRKDLADELARALEYEHETGRLSVSSATILYRYQAATEGE